MIHYKIHVRQEQPLPSINDLSEKTGYVIVEGPVAPDQLRRLVMHPDLDAFRPPSEQLEALLEIAGLPEGRIIIARQDNVILGYVTFHYPDEMERWSEGSMEDLLELGAIEVADAYRGCGLGSAMLRTAFEQEQLESYIVFTTEYYWHWDLKKSGLSVWEYRRMMEKLMQTVNMVWYATDDPEICSHPANCLMVRMGRDVPLSSQEQFDRIRFHQRFMY
ncbi:GNAT family N-acetyltransferase [Paenibacillus physcomitrellae]|uniref:Acetoin utilization protein AcuA n=1 Tax=Paenibacillus physcomitrellae TaxID=1619311 RepID=A0ABQ1FN15_9BACL|nr:GNAT family N-acetyltransferase [Paenibacillus physcomitrellae]GGA21608.1 acetoin utilization protein AcuA [Paenibacillus physcomitrellae]